MPRSSSPLPCSHSLPAARIAARRPGCAAGWPSWAVPSPSWSGTARLAVRTLRGRRCCWAAGEGSEPVSAPRCCDPVSAPGPCQLCCQCSQLCWSGRSSLSHFSHFPGYSLAPQALAGQALWAQAQSSPPSLPQPAPPCTRCHRWHRWQHSAPALQALSHPAAPAAPAHAPLHRGTANHQCRWPLLWWNI